MRTSFKEETIRLANPAFDRFQNGKEILAMAQEASRMPSRETAYRNLIFNQRVEMYCPFISKGVWDTCNGAVVEDWSGMPIYGGLDLSSVSDLSAKIYLTCVENIWHVKPVFWLPGEGLPQKASTDRVPYDLWADQGFLNTTPGRVVDYEFVAATLWEDSQRYEVRKIAFDRWNWNHLKPWLLRAGFVPEQAGRRACYF